jgi:hypothetical protein
MNPAPSSTKRLFLRLFVGLICLVLLALGITYYLDESWSEKLKRQDIIVSGKTDPITGERKDTSYYSPRLKP